MSRSDIPLSDSTFHTSVAPSGTTAPGFEAVRDVLAQQVAAEAEVGASVAASLDGEVVVDLWAGSRDAAGTRPWTADTVVNVWSISKVVSAIAVLHLIGRGLVDPSAPLSRYSDRFDRPALRGITVDQALSHSAGIPGWNQPFDIDTFYDWDASGDALAEVEPWWEPGTASGYHVASYGRLLGEVIDRVSGLRPKDYLAEHIAGPLDADFTFGLAEADTDRAAELLPPSRVRIPTAPDFDRTMLRKAFGAPAMTVDVAMTPPWRAADLGAVNGHGNARSILRIAQVLQAGSELLPDAVAEDAFRPRVSGIDNVLGAPLTWGAGLALAGPTGPFAFLPAGRIGVWGGWGGSLVVVDRSRRLTIAYAMNRMQDDLIGSPSARAYVEEIYRAVDPAALAAVPSSS